MARRKSSSTTGWVIAGVVMLGAIGSVFGGGSDDDAPDPTPTPRATINSLIGGSTPRPAPPTRRPATPEPEPEVEYVYYDSCSDARAAGAAPLRRDDPGYRPGLDRDDDGIACE